MTTVYALFLWWLAPTLGPLALPPSRADSLRLALETAPADTARVLLLAQLAYEIT